MVSISTKKPPSWILKKVKEMFGVEWESGVVFTYGNTISNSKGEMSEDLLVHENHHIYQQSKIGADEWWKLYLEFPEFRFKEELTCYRKQYQWVLQNVKNRNTVFRCLFHYARSLSGPTYGNLMSYNECIKLIKSKHGPQL